MRADPALVPALLERPDIVDAVLGRPGDEEGGLTGVSPFLVFAAAVHRATADLAQASYLPERSGLRQQVPVFDVDQLRDFLGEPMRRLFLAELLASYARVSSGRYWTKTARGWRRRRRYSELDPVALAGLLGAVPAAERVGVYRRLGDLALFLTGVFPDHAQLSALGPLDAGRLLRAAGVARAEQDAWVSTPSIELLEHLGARWYRQAGAQVTTPCGRMVVVAEVADRFRPARRVLNHVADRYLFPAGHQWFAGPG